MESSRVIVLLAAALLAGCATAAPPALSPQLEEHQRLANALQPRVRVHGGWAPEDNLGLVETAPFWKAGFGGANIWLREDIVGTPCGQYVIASLLALREQSRSLKNHGPVQEEAIKSLHAIGWTEDAARAAAASCPAR
jgi:hypothetical protein